MPRPRHKDVGEQSAPCESDSKVTLILSAVSVVGLKHTVFAKYSAPGGTLNGKVIVVVNGKRTPVIPVTVNVSVPLLTIRNPTFVPKVLHFSLLTLITPASHSGSTSIQGRTPRPLTGNWNLAHSVTTSRESMASSGSWSFLPSFSGLNSIVTV